MATYIYSEVKITTADDPLNVGYMFIDPGWASSREVAEIFISLSELHRAKFGGAGLKFEVTGKTYVVKGPLESDR